MLDEMPTNITQCWKTERLESSNQKIGWEKQCGLADIRRTLSLCEEQPGRGRAAREVQLAGHCEDPARDEMAWTRTGEGEVLRSHDL